MHGGVRRPSGVIADRYGEVIVLQCLSAGAERWRDVLVLRAGRDPGRPLRVRAASTSRYPRARRFARDAPAYPGHAPSPVTIREDDLTVPRGSGRGPEDGGSYLDQRDNRRLVSGLRAAGAC